MLWCPLWSSPPDTCLGSKQATPVLSKFQSKNRKFTQSKDRDKQSLDSLSVFSVHRMNQRLTCTWLWPSYLLLQNIDANQLWLTSSHTERVMAQCRRSLDRIKSLCALLGFWSIWTCLYYVRLFPSNIHSGPVVLQHCAWCCRSWEMKKLIGDQ